MSTELSLSMTVSLEPDDNRFQLIYATQLYSNLFALCARFQTEESQNDGCVIIKQIDFIGINYKGPISLGIVSLSTELINSTDPNADKILQIDVVLQANDTKIFTGEINKINLDYEVKRNDIIRVERALAPMYEAGSSEPIDRAFVNGKFDSEFYTRDGMYVKQKELSPENEFSESDLVPTRYVSDPMNPGTPKLIGPTCRIGESVISF